MSRSGAIDRIDTLLSTITDPAFVAVMRGEPLAIAGTPLLAFWVAGRTITGETMTRDGSITNFSIRAYFRMQSSANVRESLELDVWDAMYNIHDVLAADTELSGNCTYSQVGDAQAGYQEISGTAFRTVSIPFEVEILDDVTVAP
jgi:hypothetical protein